LQETLCVAYLKFVICIFRDPFSVRVGIFEGRIVLVDFLFDIFTECCFGVIQRNTGQIECGIKFGCFVFELLFCFIGRIFSGLF